MTIERHADYNVIAFVCDDCGEVEQTDSQDFFEAWEEVKQVGWIARKEDDGWQHLCKDCK